jgi:hypothetical protein
MEISDKKIIKWQRKKDIKKLLIALHEGLYNHRIIAAKALGEFEEEKVVKGLFMATSDKVNSVVKASVASLRKFSLTKEQVDLLEKIEKDLDTHELEAKAKKSQENYEKFKQNIGKHFNLTLLKMIEDEEHLGIDDYEQYKTIILEEIEARGGMDALKSKLSEEYASKLHNFSDKELISEYDEQESKPNSTIFKACCNFIDEKGGIEYLRRRVSTCDICGDNNSTVFDFYYALGTKNFTGSPGEYVTTLEMKYKICGYICESCFDRAAEDIIVWDEPRKRTSTIIHARQHLQDHSINAYQIFDSYRDMKNYKLTKGEIESWSKLKLK